MEIDVGDGRIAMALLRRHHALEGQLHAGEIVVGGGPGGQFGPLGLDRDAQFGELAQQPQRKLALQQPAQHVLVEQVPLQGRLDDRALARAGRQNSLGGQHLDGFAGDRTADLVLVGELGFRGEDLLVVKAGDDRLAEVIEQANGQVAAQEGTCVCLFIDVHRRP